MSAASPVQWCETRRLVVSRERLGPGPDRERLERHFGRSLAYNAYNNFTRGGFRVQVIAGPSVGHGDHLHVGFSRA